MASLVAVAACGGGGGGGDGTAGSAGQGPGGAHSVVLGAPQALGTSGRIRVEWETRGGGPTRTFAVYVQRSAADPFERVDATISGSRAEFSRGPSYRWDYPTAQVRVQACDAARHCLDSNARPLVDALMGTVAAVRPVAPFMGAAFGDQTALSTDGRRMATVAAIDSEGGVADPAFPGQGAMYVFGRGDDGTWTQEARLTKFVVPGNFGDRFALSGDGNTLVVANYTHAGAIGGIDPPEIQPTPVDQNGNDVISGAFYVFVRDAQGQWQQQAFIKSARPASDAFAYQLAVSADGNRIVVGANGRVDVFERSGGTWRQADSVPQRPNMAFLSTVALTLSADGQTFAALARTADGQPNRYFAVHVFKRCTCGDGWRFAAELHAAKPVPQTPAFEQFGFGEALSLSADGNTIAVGTRDDPGNADDTGSGTPTQRPSAGAVYVFASGMDGRWSRQAFVKARDAQAYDYVGADVSLSDDGRVLVAKACGRSANAAGLRRNHRAGDSIKETEGRTCSWGGAAYVFERAADSSWAHVAAVLPVSNALVDFLSTSMDLSGDASTLAIGTNTLLSDGQTVQHLGRMFVY